MRAPNGCCYARERHRCVVKMCSIFSRAITRLEGIRAMDNCNQPRYCMAGMAKARKEVSLSKVYLRRSLWKKTILISDV